MIYFNFLSLGFILIIISKRTHANLTRDNTLISISNRTDFLNPLKSSVKKYSFKKNSLADDWNVDTSTPTYKANIISEQSRYF